MVYQNDRPILSSVIFPILFVLLIKNGDGENRQYLNTRFVKILIIFRTFLVEGNRENFDETQCTCIPFDYLLISQVTNDAYYRGFLT